MVHKARLLLLLVMFASTHFMYPQSSDSYQLNDSHLARYGIELESNSYRLHASSIGDPALVSFSSSTSYQLRASGVLGQMEIIDTIAKPEIPTIFQLQQNYPNPFNASTTIEYGIPTRTQVYLYLYNSIGQCVKTIDQGIQQPGFYKYIWNGRNQDEIDMPSGIYLYKLQTDHFTQSHKMILMR